MITSPISNSALAANCVVWLDGADASTTLQVSSYPVFNVLDTQGDFWSGIASDSQGKWVVTGTNQYIYSLNNGNTWSTVQDFSSENEVVVAVTHGKSGQWVGLESTGTEAVSALGYTTTDLLTGWTSYTLTGEASAFFATGIIYSAYYDRYIATGFDWANLGRNCIYSSDGVTWLSAGRDSYSGNYIETVGCAEGTQMPNNRIVIVRGGFAVANQVRFAYSDDGGVTWQTGTTPTSIDNYGWSDVCYGVDAYNYSLPISGRYVACSDAVLNGSVKFAYSDDGINWQLTDTASTSDFRVIKITYANGLFIATFKRQTYQDKVQVSRDGITWKTLPTVNLLDSTATNNLANAPIVFSNDRVITVAVSSDSVNNFKHVLIGADWNVPQDNQVGFWEDKSGNDRHFTNFRGTTLTRPLYMPSISSVIFNGVNYLTNFDSITYEQFSLFVVVQNNEPAAGRTFFGMVSGNGGTDTATGVPGMLLSNQDDATSISTFLNSAYRARTSTRGVDFWDIYNVNYNGKYLSICVNGGSEDRISQPFSQSIGIQGMLNITASRIGGRVLNSLNWGFSSGVKGKISEVIMYNKALSGTEYADVQGYLQRKWSFLNQFPRAVYALKDGLWSDSTVWSISGEPAPFNTILSTDDVFTNSYSVTADTSFRVNVIRNGALLYTNLSGGNLVLSNNTALSANIRAEGVPILTLAPAASSTLIGSISGSLHGNIPACIVADTQSLNIYGDIFSLQTVVNQISGFGVYYASSSPLYIKGNLTGSGRAGLWSCAALVLDGEKVRDVQIDGNLYGGGFHGHGIAIYAPNTNLLVNGDLYPPNQFELPSSCIYITSGKTVKVIGQIKYDPFYRSTAIYQTNGTNTSISLTGNIISPSQQGNFSGAIHLGLSSNLSVTGDVMASLRYPAIFVSDLGINNQSTNVTTISVYGNIINAFNGRQAIYSSHCQVFPVTSSTYTKHAVNGNNTFVTFWTPDTTFTYPFSSDVLYNTTYKNNTLTGAMALPVPSLVYFGVPMGASNLTVSEIQPGAQYRIISPGDTDFTHIGSPNNNKGTTFTAISPTSGTGVITLIGSAILTPESLWSTSVNSITDQNANVGRLLKNVLTYQTLSGYRTGNSYNQAQNLTLFSFTDYWSDNLIWDDSVFITLSS